MIRKYVGLRTLKTGIAVALCIIVAQVLKLDSPFYAAIAAIISMGKTIGSSFQVGKNRVIGTIVGAFIGMLCAMIKPGDAIVCGIGIIILITICNILKVQGAISVGGIVLVAIMVNLNGRNPFIYSLNRVYDTLIGILIALLINVLFVPYNTLSKIKNDFEDLKPIIKANFEILAEKRSLPNLKNLKKKIDVMEQEIRSYQSEFHIKKNTSEIQVLSDKIRHLRNIYTHMEVLDSLLRAQALESKEMTMPEETVYQYHLEGLLAISQLL